MTFKQIADTILAASPADETEVVYRRRDDSLTRFANNHIHQNVTETNRSTTIAKGNVKVHTVEHVLATFAGYGIDNAIVELDSNEPPIADGSSREYCKMVQQAGVVTQNEPREPYTITEPIELKQGETMMTVFPADTFKITCTSADKGGTSRPSTMSSTGRPDSASRGRVRAYWSM